MRYAFKTYRKIDVYVGGVYSHSTNAYPTLRDAIRAASEDQSVMIATISPDGARFFPVPAGRVTACFA